MAIEQVLSSNALEKTKRNHACVLQSCPDAIDEVFDSKLHIIGGVGIAIGVVMVRNPPNSDASRPSVHELTQT